MWIYWGNFYASKNFPVNLVRRKNFPFPPYFYLRFPPSSPSSPPTEKRVRLVPPGWKIMPVNPCGKQFMNEVAAAVKQPSTGRPFSFGKLYAYSSRINRSITRFSWSFDRPEIVGLGFSRRNSKRILSFFFRKVGVGPTGWKRETCSRLSRSLLSPLRSIPSSPYSNMSSNDR